MKKNFRKENKRQNKITKLSIPKQNISIRKKKKLRELTKEDLVIDYTRVTVTPILSKWLIICSETPLSVMI